MTNTFVQLFVQPLVGYTFSLHPTELYSTWIFNNQKTVYKIRLNYGEGMHFGFNFGYNFRNNFFAELNTKRSIYSKYNVSTDQPNLQSLHNFYKLGYFGEIDYESSILQFAPVIGYKIQKEKFCIYFKTGTNFMKSAITETLKFIDWKFDNWEYYPLNTVIKYKYYGKFHLGLQSSMGLSYSIKENFQLLFDFVTVYNNYKINKTEIKFYEIDGVSQLNGLDSNLEVNNDNNKINFSHYGLNIGFIYVLNRNK